MNIGNAFTFRTDERLRNAIKRASSKKLSSEDLLEQRISFVFGSLGRDSNMTKDHVRQVVLEQGGVLQK